MKRRELPETNLHMIMGHGDLSIAEMRKIDRQRHLAERLIPPIRRRNREFSENSERDLSPIIDKNVARIQQVLRSHMQYDAATGLSYDFFVPGIECSDRFPGFHFSDTQAYVDVPQADTEVAPQANWLFYIVNRYNSTSNLLIAETNFESGNDRLTGTGVVDIHTGQIYSPNDYGLEGRADLNQTIEHTFDRLAYEVATNSIWPTKN